MAKHIYDNDYLLHTSAYVNLNDRVHQLRGKASQLVRNSWEQYITSKVGLAQPGLVLEQFRNRTEYKEFALDSLELMLAAKDEARDLKFSDLEFE